MDQSHGEINFPTLKNETEEINAWLKTDISNKQIENVSDEKITFEIERLSKDSYLELKALLPNRMFKNLKNTLDEYAKEDIVQKEINKIKEENKKNETRQLIINVCDAIILVLLFIRLFSLIKMAGKMTKVHPTEKLEYSKSLPFDGITPGQVLFIKKRGNIYMGDLFSAVLMSLKLKGVIEITNFDLPSGGYIKILEQEPKLYFDEKLIFDFLLDYVNKFGKDKMQVPIKNLKMYISNSTDKVNKLKKNIEKELKNSIPSFDESENKKISKYLRNIIYYLVLLIVMNVFHDKGYSLFTIRAWVFIVSAISMILCAMISYKANVFNEKGENDREKIRAFERYLLNFKEYGSPAVDIWEYYLIYAVALGITDKVIIKIRENYVNMGTEPCWETFNVCEQIVKCNFTKCFMVAISSK